MSLQTRLGPLQILDRFQKLPVLLALSLASAHTGSDVTALQVFNATQQRRFALASVADVTLQLPVRSVDVDDVFLQRRDALRR